MSKKLIRGLYAVMAVLAVSVTLFFMPAQKAYAACTGGMVQGSDGCCPQSTLNSNQGTANDGRCCPPQQTPDASGNCQTSPDATLDCGAGSWNWVVCTGTQLLQGAAEQVDKIIMDQLAVNTQNIFDTNCKSGTTGCDSAGAQAYYTAWNSFRIIGTGIIVLAGLVMIVAQATGFEAVDAYTIRKVLPRLGIAVIGIQLSWPLMQILINFFNVLGYDLREIMYSPFAHMPASGGQNIALALITNPLTLIGAAVAAHELNLFQVLGPSLMPLVLAVLVGVLIALAVLVIRQIAIVILVITAPVAIACYVLPGTQKVWKLWSENLIGMLMMFPIISMLIAAGHIISAVSRTGNLFAQFLSIIAYFIPYFLLPMAFKMASGFIANVSGALNDRGKGVFAGLRKWGQNSRAAQHQRMMNEQIGEGKRGAGLYRRVTTGVTTPGSGAFSMTKKGRSNYADYRMAHGAHATAEALKNDNGRAAGDDDATALAVQSGMTRSRFVQAYANKVMADAQARGDSVSQDEAMNRANAALAMTERGFGAQMGSHNMQLASFKARSASSTAYSGDEAGTQQRFNEGAELVNHGLLTVADAVAAGKGNRARTDINGAGFSTQMKAFSSAAQSKAQGGPGMTQTQAQEHLENVVSETDPAYLLSGNDREVEALMPAINRTLDKALQSGDSGRIGRALAAASRADDNLNRVSPQKAEKFAIGVPEKGIEGVNNRQIVVGGQRMTVKQATDFAKSGRMGDISDAFLNVRHEFGNRAGAAEGEDAAARRAEEERREAEGGG